MPTAVEPTAFQTITIRELHPIFGAEVHCVDFQNLSQDQFDEILATLAKYGLCVFRNTGLHDLSHIAFSRRLGQLDNVKRYMKPGVRPRFGYYELFDAGNVDADGKVLDTNAPRYHYSKGNPLARRFFVQFSQGIVLSTSSLTAFDELPPKLKKDLLGNDYIAAHCMAASRKKGSPDFFKDLHLSKEPISRHRIVQKHEPSGRTLYVAAHVHRIEGVLDEKSTELLETLIRHATQKNYTTSVAWESPRDMVIWDNRCVMHRAGGGAFEGEYVRDLRRTTVHDDNPMAWGLNETSAKWRGFSVDQK